MLSAPAALAVVALAATSAVGCTGLLGIDEYRFDGIDAGIAGSSATSTTAAAGGSGGNAGSGGVAGSASSASASSGAGGAGGEPCPGPLTCWWGGPTGPVVAEAPCKSGPAIGPCVAAPWDYCACAGQSPAVFLELGDDGEPLALTLVAPESDAPYNLQLNNGTCVDAPELQCKTSCPSGDVLYRWTDFGPVQPSDIASVVLWSKDTGAPCDPGGGIGEGEKLFVITGL